SMRTEPAFRRARRSTLTSATPGAEPRRCEAPPTSPATSLMWSDPIPFLAAHATRASHSASTTDRRCSRRSRTRHRAGGKRWTSPPARPTVAWATIASATSWRLSMFTVRVAVKVLADGREAFLAQLGKETREVPAQFAGCERFELFVDPSDSQRVFLYEEWRDRDAAQ